jgi:predicted enzyme related to lactoylglutathione lyase
MALPKVSSRLADAGIFVVGSVPREGGFPMPHAVTWFEISSNDPTNLAAFYKKAFKWKVQSQGGMEFIPPIKDGTQQGIAGSFSDARGGPGGVTVYVTCPDIDSHLEKVQAAGGTPVMPRIDLPGDMGSIATFSDPDGNKIGLWAPPPRADSAGKKAARKAGKKAGKKSAKQASPPAANQEPPTAPKKKPKKAGKKAAKRAAPAQADAAARAPTPSKKPAKKKGKK